MRRASFIALSLFLWAGCANRAATHADARAQSNGDAHAAPQVAATPAVEADDSKKLDEKEVPAAFKGVDFKNFSYPISWTRRAARLEDGRLEFHQDEVFGSGWFDLKDVGYADLTGDGMEEAVVDVDSVSCGGSCDGGSDLFYVYTIQKGRPKLLWRIESGDMAYGCGLKSFEADAGGVNIEVFRDCRLEGASLVNEPGEHAMKYESKMFTRLRFEFENGNFALKSREVFPYPPGNVMNYEAAVRVGDE